MPRQKIPALLANIKRKRDLPGFSAAFWPRPGWPAAGQPRRAQFLPAGRNYEFCRIRAA